VLGGGGHKIGHPYNAIGKRKFGMDVKVDEAWAHGRNFTSNRGHGKGVSSDPP
jgi:hypothetical protein